MKHLKGIHRFLAESYRDSLKESSPEDEASSPEQEKFSLALRNTKRLFNSPKPEELEDVNGWILDDATWILGGLVIYSKNFPFMNDESYVMISCTPMWQGEDELPIQINVADENPEILEIIEGVSKTLGVESYKEFEKNAIALIKKALFIAEDEIKQRAMDDPLFYFGGGTIEDVMDFFNGDLSWFPGGKEALSKKLRSVKIRRDLF